MKKLLISILISASIIYILYRLINFQGIIPAWRIFSGIIIAIFLVFYACYFIRNHPHISQKFNYIYTIVKCLGIFGLVYLVVCLWSLLTIIKSTSTLTGNTPYCIQVANSKGDYSITTSLLDLSILTMRGTRTNMDYPSYLQHHALLAMGDADYQLFHWSYREGKFIEGGLSSPIYCRAIKRFINTLPILFPKKENNGILYVRMLGKTYSIPLKYHPEAHGYSRSVSFSAQLPNFTPVKHLNDMSFLKRTDHTVQIFPNTQNTIENHRILSVGDKIEDKGEEYGLKKRIRIPSYPSNQPYPQYYALDNSNITTFIDCGAIAFSKTQQECKQYFYHDGVIYNYNHNIKDIEHWRSLQKRLVDRVKSFQDIKN